MCGKKRKASYTMARIASFPFKSSTPFIRPKNEEMRESTGGEKTSIFHQKILSLCVQTGVHSWRVDTFEQEKCG